MTFSCALCSCLIGSSNPSNAVYFMGNFLRNPATETGQLFTQKFYELEWLYYP